MTIPEDGFLVLGLLQWKTDWPWVWALLMMLFFVVMGISLVLPPDSPLFPIEDNYEAIAGSNAFDKLTSEDEQHYFYWIHAATGNLMIGLGIMGIILVWSALRPWIREEFPTEKQYAWQALIAGFTAWFIIDTTMSAWYEIWTNVAGNIVLFVLVVIPLVYLTPQYLQNR